MTTTNTAELKAAWEAAKSARAVSQMRLRPFYDASSHTYSEGVRPLLAEHGDAIAAQNSAYNAYCDALEAADRADEIPVNYDL
jgi:hypothetical protein